MKCQGCKQKEATVHFTEIVDEGAVKLHLCPDCAQAKGLVAAGGVVGDLLAKNASAPSGEAETRCPECGVSLEEFRKKGRLGCGRCYQAFENALEPLLAVLHRGDRHTGKVPATHPAGTAAPELAVLKESLRRAVEREKFEEAARLCELIKKTGRST